MTQDLAYDMMLEVQGLIRSLAVRTTLDHDLHVGDTFSLRGRSWIVQRVDAVRGEDLDRRLVARELDSDLTPVAA